MKILAQHRRARYDFAIIESYQAGLSLSGKMVKLMRAGRVTLNGVFIVKQNNRLEMINVGNEEFQENVPILLKKKEMNEIIDYIGQKTITCIPLNIKTVGRWVKAEIAIVKGKKNYDKRDSIKKRDIERDMAREFK